MGRKCFISFKTEDEDFKKNIQNNLDIDMIDKSLDEAIDSDDEDYILQKIRDDYLSDSTVTIHLIGTRSAENLGYEEQRYIKRELQASLYNGEGNTRSGILGVLLPSMYDVIYKGNYDCSICGGNHNLVSINDSTTVKEFTINYYIPDNDKCAWREEDRYCVLIKWDDFCNDPEEYIEKAYKKRTDEISKKVTVYP
ncbi:TIR domain-containing protein [Metallumcola ferriviriculae]|uniref:TIR domain-containing protein n=1 Tax=Metallumcola ferriviriculae TaxID=3039180 RepID=A0AAU0UH65_9FIRM|nr:TIR domain-containing protein [Desulfitibacteraceae bacterium MK1]